MFKNLTTDYVFRDLLLILTPADKDNAKIEELQVEFVSPAYAPSDAAPHQFDHGEALVPIRELHPRCQVIVSLRTQGSGRINMNFTIDPRRTVSTPASQTFADSVRAQPVWLQRRSPITWLVEYEFSILAILALIWIGIVMAYAIGSARNANTTTSQHRADAANVN